MANSVTLTFAGDSKSLDKTFTTVEKGAKQVSTDFAKAGHSTKDLGESLEGSTGKFRGGKDALDGMSDSLGAFGVAIPGPIGNIAGLAGGLADLADGLATTVLPGIKAMAAKLGIFSAATEAQTVATGEAEVAQAGLNATLLANPLFLVIAGVAALTAGFVIAYKKSETFRNIVNGAFGAIKDGAQAMGHVFKVVAEGLFLPYKLAFNAIAGAWNNTVGRLSFSIPGWVPGIGGNGFSVPHIPTFANGGRTNAGAMMVGERGPEMFVPSVPGHIVTNNQLRSGGGAGGAQTVVLQINGPSDDLFVTWLRKQARVLGGGDVQMAFGR